MKKILLIGFIIFCIFQIVVLAVDIDIGAFAIDRTNTFTGPFTVVNKVNPANATGKITSVEIWANTDLANCEVATFFVVSGNNLSTRDYEPVDNGNGEGVVIAGSKQTFVVDLNVTVGDYIGIYYSSGQLERTISGGVGAWYSTNDYIPCEDTEFTGTSSTYTLSIYGTGATEEEAGNALFWFNF